MTKTSPSTTQKQAISSTNLLFSSLVLKYSCPQLGSQTSSLLYLQISKLESS